MKKDISKRCGFIYSMTMTFSNSTECRTFYTHIQLHTAYVCMYVNTILETVLTITEHPTVCRPVSERICEFVKLETKRIQKLQNDGKKRENIFTK